MAITVKSSGTLTADGSEQTLLSTSDLGAYSLAVDLSNMTLGDRTRLRLKMKILSDSTAQLVYDTIYENVQGQPITYSPVIPATQGADFTLQQEDGTNRSYPWKVVRVDG